MSVDLHVVCFQYGLYVCVHLSKFVFFYHVCHRSIFAVSCRFMLAANSLKYATLFRLVSHCCIGAIKLRFIFKTKFKTIFTNHQAGF